MYAEELLTDSHLPTNSSEYQAAKGSSDSRPEKRKSRCLLEKDDEKKGEFIYTIREAVDNIHNYSPGVYLRKHSMY